MNDQPVMVCRSLGDVVSCAAPIPPREYWRKCAKCDKRLVLSPEGAAQAAVIPFRFLCHDCAKPVMEAMVLRLKASPDLAATLTINPDAADAMEAGGFDVRAIAREMEEKRKK